MRRELAQGHVDCPCNAPARASQGNRHRLHRFALAVVFPVFAIGVALNPIHRTDIFGE